MDMAHGPSWYESILRQYSIDSALDSHRVDYSDLFESKDHLNMMTIMSTDKHYE